MFTAIKRSWMVNANPERYNNGASELTWLYKNTYGTSESASNDEGSKGTEDA